MLFLVTVVTAMDGSGGEVRGVEEPDTGPVWFCSVLVNSDTLTAYTVSNKVSLQNQLQNPRVSNPEESNEVFDCAIRG